ncbi:PREDICTED: alpha-2,8-sialyltransferase 8E-like [Nanorana parkeri]|uniref:alpha-2,8-sialyltransferase 8E-like n=1 Tax=Nanorana parkeri TaxID=125878 RepID=UPI0008540D2D|nr:PREDICTED: alpha-2,8-sialyltransferase 8E-like [Nanorana parkeri]
MVLKGNRRGKGNRIGKATGEGKGSEEGEFRSKSSLRGKIFCKVLKRQSCLDVHLYSMLRGWRLYVLLVLAFHGFYVNLQRRMTIAFWLVKLWVKRVLSRQSARGSEEQSDAMGEGGAGHCSRSVARVKADEFREFVNKLRHCPWQYNESEHNKIKLPLGDCCNARHMLLVTQENAPLGHKLKFETDPSRKIEVTENIYRMLPKISPFLGKPFRTCAVVGNGGILLNSFCGKEIDTMDFVFRLNLPPLNLPHDIGTKSHLISANPSILIKKFGRLFESRKPFIELVKGYGSAMIILPAFSYVHNKDVSFRALYSVEDFNLENKVVFFHPEYLKNLSSHWKEMGVQANRLSSGLMMVSAAIELCNKVTLYGFWPFPRDPEGNAIPHHYYDNIYPKPGFHSMPDEFYTYTKMHSKGVLYLQVGKC